MLHVLVESKEARLECHSAGRCFTRLWVRALFEGFSALAAPLVARCALCVSRFFRRLQSMPRHVRSALRL